MNDSDVRLLRHAIAMDGWFSVTGLGTADEAQIRRLAAAGLFRHEGRVPGQTVARYVITDQGRAAAR